MEKKAPKVSRPEVGAMLKYGGVKVIEYVKNGDEKTLLKIRIELNPGTYNIVENDGLYLVGIEAEKKEEWHEDFWVKLDTPREDREASEK
jgi:hypothetical protein